MLRWLPGADTATEGEGGRLTKRALELFGIHVSRLQRPNVTIALGDVDGVEVAVVYHPNQQKADRLAGRLRKDGVAATGTSGDDHAEKALYQREPNVPAIGLSNANGPCPTCRNYFGNVASGFANVFWDDKGWLVA